MPEEGCADIGATDYRWSHRRLLAGIHGEGRPAVPDRSRPLREWGLLLGDVPGGAGSGRQAKRGGILLPVSRNLNDRLPGLELSAELAVAHDCTLLVVCSRQAQADQFPSVLRDKLGSRLVLVHLDDVAGTWLAPLASSVHRISKLHRSNDVGSKRNLGLAVAVALGWDYLLFVDDDVSTVEKGPSLDPEYLAHAVSAMDSDPDLTAVGWTLEDYDDNSVVGHARPEVGLPQGIFIGGGALLVRCSAKLPFFPDIYNEDWLFLIALAAGAPDHRRALGWAGRVHQQPYSPFRARRAASEEAGEIIGEALMNLLEDHGSRYDLAMTPSQWRCSLSSRRQLLQLIKVRASMARASGQLRVRTAEAAGEPSRGDYLGRLIDSMIAAERVHQELKPMELMEFVRTWREDEVTWHRHLGRLAAQAGVVAPAGSAAAAGVAVRSGRVIQERDLGDVLTTGPWWGVSHPLPGRQERRTLAPPAGTRRNRWAVAVPGPLQPA